MLVINFCGKKQSGKNTMGEMLVNHINKKYFPQEYAKEFAFANKLKQFCRDYLGISEDLLWGTNEDKETLTHHRWGDFPLYFELENLNSGREGLGGRSDVFNKSRFAYMTVRECLQYWGTEIFRKTNPNIWVDMLKKELEDNRFHVSYAVITDTRFHNELNIKVNDKKPISFYLLRTNGAEDAHDSENTISPKDCDFIIDNRKITPEETFSEIIKVLKNDYNLHEVF